MLMLIRGCRRRVARRGRRRRQRWRAPASRRSRGRAVRACAKPAHSAPRRAWRPPTVLSAPIAPTAAPRRPCAPPGDTGRRLGCAPRTRASAARWATRAWREALSRTRVPPARSPTPRGWRRATSAPQASTRHRRRGPTAPSARQAPSAARARPRRRPVRRGNGPADRAPPAPISASRALLALHAAWVPQSRSLVRPGPLPPSAPVRRAHCAPRAHTSRTRAPPLARHARLGIRAQRAASCPFQPPAQPARTSTT